MIKPMLCRTYEEVPPRFPCFVQPKLDGIRCIVSYDEQNKNVVAMSRGDKPLTLPPKVEAVLTQFYSLCTAVSTVENYRYPVFDGELYAHGLSFQEVMSRIKRVTHGRHEDVDAIKYCIYDLVLTHEPCRYKFRKNSLFEYLDSIGTMQDFVKYVETIPCNNQADIDFYHEHFTSEGYEGSIIRDPNSLYEQGKRSKGLIKRKDWKDKEFTLEDIREGVGKNAGTAVFILETNGLTFSVTAPGTYEEKKHFWDNRATWLSQSEVKVTVKYQELTDDGIPRFPIALGIREDGT